MDSLKINIDVQGQEISFNYSHEMTTKGAWAARIVDECCTVEESLLAVSPDKCLDALIPFISQLGKVVSITSVQEHNPYINRLHKKLQAS